MPPDSGVHTKTDGEGRFELELESRFPQFGERMILALSDVGMGLARVQDTHDRPFTGELEIPIERGGEITVRVLDAQGNPLPDVPVMASPTFLPFQHPYQRPHPIPDFQAAEASESLFFGRTDGRGEVQLAGLILESERSNEPARSGRYRIWLQTVERGLMSRRVILADRPQLLDVVVRAPGLDVSGIVKAANGDLIANARIVLNEWEARTDRNGRYALKDLPITKSYVEAEATVEGFHSRKSGMYISDDTREIELDFRLSPLTTLLGRFVTADGEAIPGLSATLEGPEGDLEIQASELGEFTVEDTSRGPWELSRVHINGYYWNHSQYVLGGTGEAGEFVLHRRRMGQVDVAGTVTSLESGEPLATNRLAIYAQDSSNAALKVDRFPGGFRAQGLYPGRWVRVTRPESHRDQWT